MQISKNQFNKDKYCSLGNRALLFPCRNKLTNKIKNINIYEWQVVCDQYEILDFEKFDRANKLK
jgi:hypothetical protein